MKKIITLSMIKNEADILETFVRYTMNYAYKMIFIDNGCTDGSIEILRALKDEGFNIDIYNEANVYYEQCLMENKYIRKIAENYEFDYLIPLDADEFLACSENLEEQLDKLSVDKVSILKWKTYCMTEPDEKGFFLDRITHVRHNEKTVFTKVIIPYLMLKKKIYVTPGHHDVEGDCNIEKEYIDHIYIAHFPVRSENQIRLKIYQGILAQLMSSYHSVIAFHWKKMFNDLRMGLFDIVEYSKNYALKDDEDLEQIYYSSEKFDYSWCKNDITPQYIYFQNKNGMDIIYDFAEIICLKSIIGANDGDSFKEKLLVYGTGGTARNLSKHINMSKYHIVAYIDSDITLEYSSFMNKLVIGPDKIKFLEFDRILVASNFFEEICSKLLELGIPKEKIISRFDLLEEQIK